MNNTLPDTLHATLKAAAKQLAPSSSAMLDAEILLAHALQKPRSYLFTWPEKILTEAQHQQYIQLLARRTQGEPVAYITNTKEFWSLAFQVTPATLIPRPETELLVEATLTLCRNLPRPRILELGTGSGCIAIAIAHERPDARLIATDISPDALDIARSNATRHHATSIQFIRSDWFSALSKLRFDLIISNPPYIAEQDTHLQHSDLRYEPITALTAGTDGLRDITQITAQAHHYLNANGRLLLEIGYDQAEKVRSLLQTHHFTDIDFIKDYNSHLRICSARAHH